MGVAVPHKIHGHTSRMTVRGTGCGGLVVSIHMNYPDCPRLPCPKFVRIHNNSSCVGDRNSRRCSSHSVNWTVQRKMTEVDGPSREESAGLYGVNEWQ